jgi:hypothetical protein
VQHRTSKRLVAAALLEAVCGKHPARAALLLSALSLTTAIAAQQQQPSDDELHSMYCVEVIRAEIDLQHHLISASDAAAASAITPALRQQWIDTSVELNQGLARLEIVRYRLQVYMLPKIPALDSYALATAMRQGDADFQESRAAADRCAVECSPLNRVSVCDKPTWLPP